MFELTTELFYLSLSIKQIIVIDRLKEQSYPCRFKLWKGGVASDLSPGLLHMLTSRLSNVPLAFYISIQISITFF